MKRIFIIQIALFVLIPRSTVLAGTQQEVRKSNINDVKIHIRVLYDQAKANDILSLYYYENILGKDPIPGVDKVLKIDAQRQPDASYDFSFTPNSNLGYFAIKKKFKAGDPVAMDSNLLDSHLVQRGDNLTIEILFKPKFPKNNSLKYPFNMVYKFYGVSARNYKTIQIIDSVMQSTNGNNELFDKQLVYNSNFFLDNQIKAGLGQLEKSKQYLNKMFYNQLKANLFYGETRWVKYTFLKNFYKDIIIAKGPDSISLFRKHYTEMSDADELALPTAALFHSDSYAYAELQKMLTDDYITFGKINYDRILKRIETNYRGAVRDKLIAEYFQAYGNKTEDYTSSLIAVSALVKNSYAAELLKKLKTRSTGSIAYNFRLPNENNKIISLSDFKGKIVFIDFWFTGCSNCSHYYQTEVSKAENYFKNDTSVVFLTICADKGLEQWKSSVNTEKYTSPGIINLYTNNEGFEHPILKIYGVRSYPHPMLVSRTGRIIKYGEAGLRNNDDGSVLIATIKVAEKQKNL